MTDRDPLLDQAAKHWSGISQARAASSTVNWWQSKAIVAHINARICGEPLAGLTAGFHRRIRQMTDGQSLPRAISVGCGAANKEMALVRAGLADHFDLYEIAQDRIAQAQAQAEKFGIAGNIRFLDEDPVAHPQEDCYDLVHWDNALHHMLDVEAAVDWSHRVLKPGGIFAMYDFVGPNRFQWTDRNLDYIEKVRNALPLSLMAATETPGARLRARIERPDPERLMAVDPTEAADSQRIPDAILKHFPHAEIVPTGGAIYHVGLKDILARFTDEDAGWMDFVLMVDQLLADLGETHYAVAIVRKGSS
ncbi:MAG: class I SAM-dependent methyltransferase [Pseudomonadales bacterium]